MSKSEREHASTRWRYTPSQTSSTVLPARRAGAVAVAALRQAISHADALIIATPEYNSSVPGALKNALDWASRPWPDNGLRGKPVCVIGASTGRFGAVWPQAELRKILTTIGADVIDQELPVGQAHEAFDADGALADPDLRARVAESVAELIERAVRGPAEAWVTC